MASIKMVPVYLGRETRGGNVPKLNQLTVSQDRMLKIGQAGLDAIKDRLRSGRDEHDSPYEPLQRRYARWKSYALRLPPGSAKRNFQLGRYREKGARYLKLKPEMDTLLGNLKVRKVSDRMAEARNSSVAARKTAGGLNQLYQRHGHKGWLLFSPHDLNALGEAATRIIGDPHRIIFQNFTKVSGGRLQ